MANLNRQLPPWMTPRSIAQAVPAQAGAGPAAQPQNTTPGMPDIPALQSGQFFGDAVTLPIINATVNNSVLALPRPPPGTRRTLLIVQNQLVGTILPFAFGRAADNLLSSPGIPANGNLLLDQLSAIPQNELYLFFPIAGLVTITYINAAIV